MSDVNEESQIVCNGITHECDCEFFNDKTTQLTVSLKLHVGAGSDCKINLNVDSNQKFQLNGKIVSESTHPLNDKLFQVLVKLDVDKTTRSKLNQIFASPEEKLVQLFENFQTDGKSLKNKVS